MMRLLCKAAVCLLVALVAELGHSQGFSTITIRPAKSTDVRIQMLPDGSLIATAVPVIVLLSYAYDIPVDPSPRLSPLPDWTIHDRYDIEAKAGSTASSPTLHGTFRARLQQGVRKLLADRFGLAMRVENKTMSVYALTVSRDGQKLQKSAANDEDCILDTEPEGCHNFTPGFGHPLDARAIDMDDLARYIANWTDLPVVNRTSLKGLFAVHTEGWLPMRLPPPPPGTAPDRGRFAGLPTIFTVLGKLGLELHRQESSLPIYHVVRIKHPTTD